MTTLRIGLALMAASAVAPATVAAATVVPPGNSAATQYTEAIPTGGGEADAQGRHGHRSPQRVLGAGNAAHLDSRGPDGRATAQLAADTAPSGGASPGGGPNGGGAAGSGTRSDRNGSAAGASRPAPAQEPAGPSGAGSVLGQATGASSGQLGIFLPLAILGAIGWAAVYLLRERRRVE